MRGSRLPLPFGLERAYLVLQDMPRPSETLLPWPRAAQCSPCAARRAGSPGPAVSGGASGCFCPFEASSLREKGSSPPPPQALGE